MKLSRSIWASIIVTILLFTTILPFATGEETALVCHPISATFSPVRDEEVKEWYYFLTVAIDFENYTANSYDLGNNVQCNLLYQDSYSIPGTFIDCETNSIQSLMQINGAAEFEVPNMLVESAGSDLILEFVVDGQSSKQPLSDVDYLPSPYEFDRYEFSYDDYTSDGFGADNIHSFGKSAYIIM